MFWVLVFLASGTFAPCVLVPAWQELRALTVLESVESQGIEQLRADVRHRRRHLDALREDPMVVARVALRDLAYSRPNESTVFLPAGAAPPRRHRRRVVVTAESPAVLRRVLSWLPYGDRSDVFADPARRMTLIGLSGALLVAAFVLYPPRRTVAA